MEIARQAQVLYDVRMKRATRGVRRCKEGRTDPHSRQVDFNENSLARGTGEDKQKAYFVDGYIEGGEDPCGVRSPPRVWLATERSLSLSHQKTSLA